MLQRYPSFIPLRRHATSIASVAFLVPSSDSALRQATATAAVFNMTATIVGGGVLSIPLSCARAGIVPFTILMILSASLTDFSLYVLCSCARRTGSTTYGRVARVAVGPTLELFTTAVIFFLVAFIVVGLMVLNQGIWTPIVVTILSPYFSGKGDVDDVTDLNIPRPTTALEDAIVLMIALGIMFPFLLKRDLTALRHICYVGFFSILVLCIAMAYRAFEKNVILNPGTFKKNVGWYSSSFLDVLNALPIILLAFLCSFNIISVHCSLVDPTRPRVRNVIHMSVLLSFLLMYLFGLAGYLCAYEDTDGNILLNFDPSDKIIFLGRIGCGITTLFALPMNLLPCREALLSLVVQIGERRVAAATITPSSGSEGPTIAEAEGRPLLTAQSCPETSNASSIDSGISMSKCNTAPLPEPHKHRGENGIDAVYDSIPWSPPQPTPTPPSRPKKRIVKSFAKQELMIHRATTFGIVTMCYIAAVLAPGVAIVWDIAGSSMSFLVQFIIPAICYIRLKTKLQRDLTPRVVRAWGLLVVASAGAVLCTTQTIWRMLAGSAS